MRGPITLTLASFVIGGLLTFPLTSWAFRVSPMIVSFTPLGSGSTQSFLLENTDGQKIAVQIETFHRNVDREGKESRIPTDEFTIYPLQLTLQPNEQRVVRVTWNGDRQPDQELNYRLVVSELSRKAGTNPSFLMQYVASLYISPPNVAPRVVVDSFKVLSDGRGELVLKNSGSAHRVLKGIRIFLKFADGTKTELKNDQMDELRGENLLTGSSRRFYLSLPSEINHSSRAQSKVLGAEVEFN